MKFSKEEQEYLDGLKFSNGHRFKVAKKNQPNKKRVDFLIDYVRNKSVLHIGFTDHIPLIKRKLINNEWLHKLLMDSSSSCIGIDINVESVEYVKNDLGIADVFSLDITKEELPLEIQSTKFDVVILGEVLEHVDNPVHFLNEINLKLRNHAEELIITVPNALDLTNLLEIKNGIEFINTDHRYWFTPFTLLKVLSRANFRTNDFIYLQTWIPRSPWKRLLISRFPMLRETLVSVSNFK